MTTVSSTSGANQAYSTSNATSTGTTAASDAPYDGAAAVAQAEAKAAAAITTTDSSSSLNKLLGLNANVIELLQGGEGSDLLNTLIGTTGTGSLNSLFTASLTKTAVYAAAQKRVDANSSPVGDLITQINAALNGTDTTTDGATGTDTTA